MVRSQDGGGAGCAGGSVLLLKPVMAGISSGISSCGTAKTSTRTTSSYGTDTTNVSNIEPRQISKIKKLVYLLAVSVPFMPNITKLSQATDISRPKLYEYLELLREAKILNLIREKGRGYNILSKPEKIYLENPNLMYAVSDCDKVNIGSVREVFFVNQILNYYSMHPHYFETAIELPSSGDFLVKGDFTFEVGGKNKNFKQITNVRNAYLALDDIEIGFKKKIPLWLFGFLY